MLLNIMCLESKRNVSIDAVSQTNSFRIMEGCSSLQHFTYNYLVFLSYVYLCNSGIQMIQVEFHTVKMSI